MTNRLQHESSPYLQQHAHNPVDWYAWGDEALARARAEDKPILLSVGYSACHWCHVMERESFEDPATAALMNEHFVNIKVDREERPDVDQIYQTAVQVLGRHGGWPLTMFLTPSLKPFYGGTYFPPADRYGMPAFKRILVDVSRAFHEQREQVDRQADELAVYVGEVEGEAGAEQPLTAESFVKAARGLLARFDTEHGGLGGRPKFPNSSAMEMWLRTAVQTGESGSKDAAVFSLRKMIEGGIYDQLGGGFHRYSTDERWLIPHFEKMLYDNAQLLVLLAQTYQATGEALFATAARETADYVLREMQSPAGGFYSTQDADSEGEEGRFFGWTPKQLAEILPADDVGVVEHVLGVSEAGNFEHGLSVLHRAMPVAAAAKLLQRDAAAVEAALARSRPALFEARERREHPHRDEKIITAWNGLMIRGLAVAGSTLGEPRYVEAAQRASDFAAVSLWHDGTLLRTWRDGRAKIAAFSEDHAFLAEGELALFSATGDPRHFERARKLVDLAIELFWDEKDAGFFVTRTDGEALFHRPKSTYDNAVPSATASMVHAMLQLHALTGEGAYAERAERTLRLSHEAMVKNPFGYTYLWCALDAAVSSVATLVVIGHPGDPTRDTLIRAVRGRLAPNLFVLPWSGRIAPPSSLASLVEGKGPETAAYLCRGASCTAPVRTPDDLDRLLDMERAALHR